MSKKVGELGEKIAVEFLKKKGYKILDRNFVFKIPKNPKFGEIDIVAKKGDTIFFIEVKTLTNNGQTVAILPEEKINFQKRRKLIKTAEGWLIKNKIPLDKKWQIDVISILFENRKAKISHFENAISDPSFLF